MTKTIDQQLDEHTFLRKSDLERITGLGYSTLHRLQQQQWFPRPHRITSGTSVWLKTEVLDAMKSLIETGSALETN